MGHQNALLAGLMTAREDADMFISIDAGLQDDITVIPEMVENILVAVILYMVLEITEIQKLGLKELQQKLFTKLCICSV